MGEDKDTHNLNINIAVENFGPIERAEIDLRPLTVFVGEGNTGKTYLAALIYALHRIYGGLSRIPWSRSGNRRLNLGLGTLYSDILRAYTDEDISEVPEKQREFLLKFSDLPPKMQDKLRTELENRDVFSDELKRCFDLESISNLIRFTADSSNEMKVSLQINEDNHPLWSVDVQGAGSSVGIKGYVNEDMVLQTYLNADIEKMLSNDRSSGTLDIENLLNFYLLFSEKGVRSSYYLPAARSGIMQSHGVIASSLVDRTTRVGLERFPEIATFSGMIADFLKYIITYRAGSKPAPEINSIVKILENDVLRGQIAVRRAAGIGSPEFLYSPQKTEQSLHISQSASMVSELAPLVLFLRGIVAPGDTLIIEEPEAHLHPRAQTQIARILAQLVRADVRVIITTHSDWLLEQIGNLILEGEAMKLGVTQTELTPWLTTEEVGAWWFQADKPVENIKFDRIEGINPPDYYDVASALYKNAVEYRQQLQEKDN